MSDKVGTVEDDFLAGDMLLDDIDELIGDEGAEGQEGSEGDNPDAGDDGTDDKGDDTGSDNAAAAAKPGDDNKPADPTKEVESDNEHYLRALYWQEQNLIPKDVELSKDMTQLDFEELYAASIHDNAMATYRAEIKDKLVAKGIDPDEIFPSAQQEEILFRDAYQAIAKATYEDMEDKYPDEAALTKTIRDLSTEYFVSKSPNLDEDAIETLVKKDFDKLTQEEAYEKYQKHFAAEALRLTEKIKNDAQSKKQREISQAESDALKVRQLLESGEIGKRKFNSDEIKKIQEALYVKNQVFIDADGVRHRVTLHEKIKRETESNLTALVSEVANRVLGIDAVVIADKSERRGKHQLLDKIANASASKTNSQNKKNANEAELVSSDMYLPD